MSSLFQDKKRGGWIYQYSVGGRQRQKRLPKEIRTRAEARRLQALWDAKLLGRKLGMIPARCGIEDSITEYLNAKALTLKPKSLERYVEVCGHFRDFCRRSKLTTWDQVNEVHVDRYHSDRKTAGRAPKTIDDELTQIRCLLKWLWTQRKIAEIPVRRWPKIKTIPTKPETLSFYSSAEIGALLEHFRFRELGPSLAFAVFTGARYNDIRNAQVRDVRFSEEIILIRFSKTEAGADTQYLPVAIHDNLKKVLEERTAGRDPEELLFPELGSHSKNWPREQLKKACRELGITYRRFHGIRHTVATYMALNGASLTDIMATLGWTQIETAQRYIHNAEKIRQSAVRKLTWGNDTIKIKNEGGKQESPE